MGAIYERSSKMIYLSSAFSLNMIGEEEFPVVVDISEISEAEACAIGTHAENIIGHPDMASLVGEIFEMPLKVNRESVRAAWGDMFIVAQYRGPRLPAGSTTLPENAEIRFYKVFVGDV
jgi:hypothetical protein